MTPELFYGLARVLPPDTELTVPADAGDLILGWRAVAPDLRSSRGHRDPWPGGWVRPVDDGRDWSRTAAPNEACPSRILGGWCVAHTWQAARSGGHPASTVLLVGYPPDSVLGIGRGDEMGKVRVGSRCTLAVIDVPRLIRDGQLRGANLYGANLYGADLSGANLTWANLNGANLIQANFARANLTGANLNGANLYGANLYGADLTWANLTGANLIQANFTWANLRWANLTGANLNGANLYGADLYGADLTWANLTEANLIQANFTWANLRWAKADSNTRLPNECGWHVEDGRIVRSQP